MRDGGRAWGVRRGRGWPRAVLAAVALLLTLAGGLLPVGGIWAGRGLIDAAVALIHPAAALEPSASAAPLLRAAALWAGAVLATGLLGPAAANLALSAGDALRDRVREELMAAILARAAGDPLVTAESADYQDAAARARGTAGFQVGDATLTLTFVVEAAARAGGAAALLFAVAWPLPLLILGAAFPLLWHKVRRSQTRYSLETALVPSRRLADDLAGLFRRRAVIAEAQVFGFGPHLLRRWAALAGQERRARQTGERAEVLAGLLADAALTAGGAAALAVLALVATGPALQAGGFVAALAAAASLQADIESGLWMARDLHTDLLYARDLFAFLDRGAGQARRVEVARRPAGSARFPRPLHTLRCEGLGFSYPGAGRPALSDLDLVLEAGERVAIVGSNGAGKSTLVRLLSGLYLPERGRLTADGIDRRAVDTADWMAAFGVAFQDHSHLCLEGREAVAAGRPLPPGAVERAAEAAGCIDLAGAAQLGSRFGGIEPSGGQWQRLALARALAGGGQVLILDEPASALDPVAEAELYERLGRLAGGRTTVLVSHRLGSARLADRIVVLDSGTLAETGSHRDLLAAGGLYQAMWEAQAAWYR